jgi:hypothetical protein
MTEDEKREKIDREIKAAATIIMITLCSAIFTSAVIFLSLTALAYGVGDD